MSGTPASPGPWFRATHALWLLWLLPAPAAALLIAWMARSEWDPDRSGQEPSFGYTADGLRAQLLAALVVAIFLAGASLVHVGVAFLCVASRARSARFGPLSILLAIPLAAGPLLVRAIVPMESPYDGTGSPLAVLVSLVFFALLGVVAALPGLVLLTGWAMAEPPEEVAEGPVA